MLLINKIVPYLKRAMTNKVDIDRRFEKQHKLGQGSMSEVWRARDKKSGRTIALKVLDKEKARRLEARFAGLKRPSEGSVAIRLRHPHIVKTLEHGLSNRGEQYLVMELVKGSSLPLLIDLQNDVMQAKRLTFMIQMGEGLDYFHKQGWIHRDMCPRNVLVNKQHEIKLIDFGLVVPNTPEFRVPGNRTGTASYMAPELVKRMPTDQRIDIYSYAVSCYEMFAKRLPYNVDPTLTLDMVIQHINTLPTDIRELVPDIDDHVAATIMKGLSPDPDHRFAAASEMVHQFIKARERLEPESEYEYYDEQGPDGNQNESVPEDDGGEDDEYEYEYEYEDEEEENKP